MELFRSALGASRGLSSQDERFPDARIAFYASARLNVEPIQGAEGLPKVAIRALAENAPHKAVVPDRDQLFHGVPVASIFMRVHNADNG